VLLEYIPIGDSLLEDFLEHSKHPIHELEIFPILALKIWQERLDVRLSSIWTTTQPGAR